MSTRITITIGFLLLTLFLPRANATDFVGTSGTGFTLAGKPFRVAGVNNHYLTFGTPIEVTRVLDDAVALGANVVRLFLQPVIGSLDGSVPTIWDKNKTETGDLGVNGTYLLYWDNAKEKMAINDGPDGMQKVDFVIAESKKRNLKLIIAFVDFWAYTGGAQQMRAWYGSLDKTAFFFEDARTQRDYKTWVSYVIHRMNPNTGLRYCDDPTILAWELANEPNARPEQLRHVWVNEMSQYVKSQDKNHLVSSGHANSDIRNLDIIFSQIDFETWHGYPKFLNETPAEFTERINQYCIIAEIFQKPMLLEEFGYARSNLDQVAAYTQWLNTLAVNHNCAGWLVWRLVSRQENGYYPKDDYDQFDVRNDGGPLWEVLKKGIRRTLNVE